MDHLSRSIRFRFGLAATLCVFAALAIPAQAGAVEALGPLPVRNHHPLYVGLLYPPPEGGATVTAVTWRAAVNHSNIFMVGQTASWKMDIDKELAEMDLSLRVPLFGGRLVAGVEAPLYYSWAGFLDGLVRWYHGRLGVPGYVGQAETADFRFSDEIFHNEKQIRDGARNRLLPGDATIWIKARLPSRAPLAVSLQGLVQAPTGDADRGAGNGDWEVGARVVATYTAQRYALHFGGGLLAPARIRSLGETTRLYPYPAGFFAGEYFWSERFRLIAQTMFNASPIGTAAFKRLRKFWINLTGGFKYMLANGAVVAAGFSEELNKTAPDFTFHLSIEMKMPDRRR